MVRVLVLTVFVRLEALRQARPFRPLLLPVGHDPYKMLRQDSLVEDQVALRQGDIGAIYGSVPWRHGAAKKKKVFLWTNITFLIIVYFPKPL